MRVSGQGVCGTPSVKTVGFCANVSAGPTMKLLTYLFAFALMVAGVVALLYPTFGFIAMFLSGTPLSVESIFATFPELYNLLVHQWPSPHAESTIIRLVIETIIRFVIAWFLIVAGKGLWKTGDSYSRSNLTFHTPQHNRSRRQQYHNRSSAYHEDVQIGDQYHIPGQAGAVGRNAHAHHMSFTQHNAHLGSSIDLSRLEIELSALREVMRNQARAAEDSIAVGEVARAEQAAKAKDPSRVAKHLRAAGGWALDVASEIGVPVAVEAIKRSMGM